MRAPDELRALVEATLDDLALPPVLAGLAEPMRYALGGGGKRIRPVLCLATTEAAGGSAESALPAAIAVELVHSFSLVHDDLPALDDDDERRGRPSAHVTHGEGVALLAGDALLTEALRLAVSYDRPEPARELAEATLGMIGGQYLDITGANVALEDLHRLKTGRLFAAAVGLGLWAANVPEAAQAPWRAFGEELGLLFQAVDDVIDGDGYASELGEEGARDVAAAAARRAHDRLEAIEADTSVLAELVLWRASPLGVSRLAVEHEQRRDGRSGHDDDGRQRPEGCIEPVEAVARDDLDAGRRRHRDGRRRAGDAEPEVVPPCVLLSDEPLDGGRLARHRPLRRAGPGSRRERAEEDGACETDDDEGFHRACLLFIAGASCAGVGRCADDAARPPRRGPGRPRAVHATGRVPLGSWDSAVYGLSRSS
jgi:geranylgeranyl diphosphate synthase, type II